MASTDEPMATSANENSRETSELVTSVQSKPNTHLELLPNELFLLIFSNLSSSDIVEAFFGLNQRCNSLVLESARHLTLFIRTPSTWFVTYMPIIENVLETISLNVEMLLFVFPCTLSYPLLRTIILSKKYRWQIELKVEHESAFHAVVSSLHILQLCKIIKGDNLPSPRLLDSDYIVEIVDDTSTDTVYGVLPCTAMRRVVTSECNDDQLFRLCAYAPNLTYLRIGYLNKGKNEHFGDIIMTDLTIMPTYLTELHITGNEDRRFDCIEEVVELYQSSLERLTLDIGSCEVIDGRRLEKLLQPCLHLKKLSFINQCENENIDIIDLLHSFQSDWWLDARRPPVFVQRDAIDYILIASMPCSLSMYHYPLCDLKEWHLSKEQLDSSLIRFTKAQELYFQNTSPVNLDFLYFIGRVFCSRDQCVTFTYWGLISEHTLFEELINTTTTTPVLPNVTQLLVKDCDGFGPLTLPVWLLLAPNVNELSLEDLSIENIVQLVAQLAEGFQMDERARTLFKLIDSVSISLNNDDRNNEELKSKLHLTLVKMFSKVKMY